MQNIVKLGSYYRPFIKICYQLMVKEIEKKQVRDRDQKQRLKENLELQRFIQENCGSRGMKDRSLMKPDQQLQDESILLGKGSINTDQSPTKLQKSVANLKIEENEVHLTVPDDSTLDARQTMGDEESPQSKFANSIHQKTLQTAGEDESQQNQTRLGRLGEAKSVDRSVDVNWDPTTDPVFAELDMHFVFRVLNSLEFMSEVPLYVNSMETHSNIRLVISSLIIFRKDLLPLPKIREGLRAFHLAALMQKSKMKLSLAPDDINTCLRLINLTLPKKFVREWSNLNKPMLECFNPNSNRIELEKQFLIQSDEFKEYLLPHEFLFMLPNCLDRIKVIKQLKVPVSNTTRQTVQNFELAHDTHVYQIEDNAFADNAPQTLIRGVMAKYMQVTDLKPVSGLDEQVKQDHERAVAKVKDRDAVKDLQDVVYETETSVKRNNDFLRAVQHQREEGVTGPVSQKSKQYSQALKNKVEKILDTQKQDQSGIFLTEAQGVKSSDQIGVNKKLEVVGSWLQVMPVMASNKPQTRPRRQKRTKNFIELNKVISRVCKVNERKFNKEKSRSKIGVSRKKRFQSLIQTKPTSQKFREIQPPDFDDLETSFISTRKRPQTAKLGAMVKVSESADYGYTHQISMKSQTGRNSGIMKQAASACNDESVLRNNNSMLQTSKPKFTLNKNNQEIASRAYYTQGTRKNEDLGITQDWMETLSKIDSILDDEMTKFQSTTKPTDKQYSQTDEQNTTYQSQTTMKKSQIRPISAVTKIQKLQRPITALKAGRVQSGHLGAKNVQYGRPGANKVYSNQQMQGITFRSRMRRSLQPNKSSSSFMSKTSTYC